MLYFNRRLFVLTATLLVAGCGFSPVYGPGGTGSALQNAILVDEPQDQNAYWLVQRIEEKLGRAGDPSYSLSLKIAVREQGTAINQQGDIARYDLLGRADYELRKFGSDVIVASGKATSFTGYSATGTSLVSLASERDARERLMVILADQIISRLVATADLPT